MTATSAPSASKRAFKQRVHVWAQKLEVPVAWLAVRPMAGKWASCSSKGHLHFSVDLLNLEPDLWDYVIVHELLHLSVPNHGKLFQALMRAHLGDWERAATKLQEHAGPAPG
jgi:predicted metal-dependent hydrolase